MSRRSFFQDMLSGLFDASRYVGGRKDKRSLTELSNDLLSARGEASGVQIAAALLDKFAGSDDETRLAFFSALADDHDVDTDTLNAASQSYAADRSAGNLTALLAAAEPRRQQLLRRLNQAPAGTERLVAMRAELLGLLKDNPQLARIDVDFERLFTTWFNRGFLVMQPIDWGTPADILEKIIRYEAVHAINDWDDLRRRLQPSDRRCFAFFHPAMSNEPLIFVEVALTKGIPGSIQGLLAEDREACDETEANTAVFYSISNCQKGLRGVSFGSFLIKQVAQDLSGDLRKLGTFVTLSPVPGFRAWLAAKAADLPGSALEEIFQAVDNDDDPSDEAGLRALVAHYLINEKRSDGLPLDPVARFHLGNGASLKNIHWNADMSEKGMQQSAGMMVNYLYDLDAVEANHEAYTRDGTINAAREVRALPNDKLLVPEIEPA